LLKFSHIKKLQEKLRTQVNFIPGTRLATGATTLSDCITVTMGLVFATAKYETQVLPNSTYSGKMNKN